MHICSGMVIFLSPTPYVHLLLLFLRKLSPKALLIMGLYILAITSLTFLMTALSWNYMPPETQEGIRISWQSTAAKIARGLATYRGGWLEQMQVGVPESLNMQTSVFFFIMGWRAAGIILIGMAFSNYILQTLLCTFIFYGHGLGLYGYVERAMQILVVFIVWVICVIFSVFWLRKFQFGPVEWLWRSLTYGKFQPFNRSDR